MSATINADLFSKYFNGAPIMHIPVTFHFSLNKF
jgi:HrpA-like RNA helicase